MLKSFNKEYKKYLYCLDRENDFKEFPSIACAKEEMPQKDYDKVLKITEKATYQAMEAFIHNMCSLNSRAGSQVPFSSINFGLETSIEGRMVVEQYLKAHIAGLGRGETSIFPIAIYTLKKGINFNPEDPNYDLFRLAMECSSKRQFPTYAFVDSSFNLPYYEKDNIRGAISYMGCRTRVVSNVNGEETPVGRGNLSFATINLPYLALEAKGNLDKFMFLLDKYLEITAKGLLERYDVQRHMKVKNFPFLMGQHLYYNSDHLGPEDYVEDAIKNGTLSIGFIGLAETLLCLTGKHQGESEESQKLGLEIISHIRKYCDDKTAQTHLNFSCLGTPAETYCMRARDAIVKRFGVIKDISDREYLTNSCHVPVWYNISFKKKMEIEGAYHKYCNAG